ncbi:16S rRNA (cytosine(1402)-N(4))-methyltransferase RsmH [bacterium]|jgi:16S rRNA (cytosine1402-N4)-methyltransferase|nr:16S rRNA (cytosine(1402)-N(4))-methyltransferase RsmH [bacterium]MBT5015547.1 16S rRNA (cytosine(1402)-N(4))-methyltransferase RsmH [bacterium]
MSVIHKPVLVQEVLEYLDPQPGKVYVDVTFGAGGHTREILQAEPNCKVIAFDWDKESIKKFAPPLEKEFPGRIQVLWGNFSLLYRLVKKNKIKQIDGILADFGTSQMQIFERDGFSFKIDTPLDMRMSAAHHKITAAEVLNKASARDLQYIFSEYGEERYSRTIALAIVEERKTKKFRTTKDLADFVAKVVPYTKRKIHPSTRVFQALRIYVNKELDNIKAFLVAALEVLPKNGRLVCISFHSLEDRLVKEFFRNNPCVVGKGLKSLTKKLVTATDEEIAENPSCRSARLRAAQVCIDDN